MNFSFVSLVLGSHYKTALTTSLAGKAWFSKRLTDFFCRVIGAHWLPDWQPRLGLAKYSRTTDILVALLVLIGHQTGSQGFVWQKIKQPLTGSQSLVWQKILESLTGSLVLVQQSRLVFAKDLRTTDFFVGLLVLIGCRLVVTFQHTRLGAVQRMYASRCTLAYVFVYCVIHTLEGTQTRTCSGVHLDAQHIFTEKPHSYILVHTLDGTYTLSRKLGWPQALMLECQLDACAGSHAHAHTLEW